MSGYVFGGLMICGKQLYKNNRRAPERSLKTNTKSCSCFSMNCEGKVSIKTSYMKINKGWVYEGTFLSFTESNKTN